MTNLKDDFNNEEITKIISENKKLKFKILLQKNLSEEVEKQKETVSLAKKQLEKESKKLKLESMLSKNLTNQLEKEKVIALDLQNKFKKKSDELESLSAQLSKYLSPQVYKSIFSGTQKVNLSSSRKKLTVFFSDIVGFTNMSDNLESEELTSMLNFYLNQMATIALNKGGTIDKFIGDAILIFFGDPETKGVKEDAIKCVSMAIEMQNKMTELKEVWSQKFGMRKPLQMRIGITTGYCTVGNFGSDDRLDYTVIGGQVNLASRLESASSAGGILISHDTYVQVKDKIDCISLGDIKVKGIKESIPVYRVNSGNSDDKMSQFNSTSINLLVNEKKLNRKDYDEMIKYLEGKIIK